MKFTRTKITCTLGPATDSLEMIIELIESGMNVARINMSHGSKEEHVKRIAWVKEARSKLGVPCAIMIDTKGPEIRVGEIPGGSIKLTAGDVLKLTEKPVAKDEISIHPFEALGVVEKNMKILFDDGYIETKVIEVKKDKVLVEILNGGVLTSKKGVNIPTAHLDLPAMTEEDIRDIKFGCEQEIDLIAASFIRSAEHVLAIKKLLAKESHENVMIIAKIENGQGVENFDSIVQVADGIMVARGDLGVEMDLGMIPKLQKMIIRKCFDASKPVITATQMLESMILNPRPTRAEVSDVANAIYDGSSGLMLSGETAIGKYPIETVKLMKKIIKDTEEDYDYREFFYLHSKKGFHNVSSAVSMAAVKTAYSTEAKAIFAFTTSGFTARQVSRLRPEMPIMAVTGSEKNYHQLAASWGVIPIFQKTKNAEESFAVAKKFALDNKYIDFGDHVVVTAGSSFGRTGSTNMLIVESVGDILVRGAKGVGSKISGKVKFFVSPEKEDLIDAENAILVIPKCDNTYLELMKNASGVILENHEEDTASEKYALLIAKNLEIPVIVRAQGAMNILKEGTHVTLDPKRSLIYSV